MHYKLVHLNKRVDGGPCEDTYAEQPHPPLSNQGLSGDRERCLRIWRPASCSVLWNARRIPKELFSRYAVCVPQQEVGDRAPYSKTFSL